MSRHIWSVKTFKKRVGKSVTVDGTRCAVSEKDGKYIIHSKDGTLHLELEEILLRPWLRRHIVVASGYPLKRGPSKPVKDSQEYTRDFHEVPFDTMVNVKFMHLDSVVQGMFIKDREVSGQFGVFFVSNDYKLDGCPCKNRRGFKFSYLLSANEERSSYLFKDVELVTKEPASGLYRITYGKRSCIGKLKKASDGTYIITDDPEFEGAFTSESFREGLKYSWWVADINVPDLILEPVSEPDTKPEPEKVQEKDEGPVKEDKATTDVLDTTIRELLELVVAKLKA